MCGCGCVRVAVRLANCARRCEQTIPIHLRSTWDMCNDIVWDVAEAFLDSRKGVQEVVKETAAQRLQWQTRRDRIYRRVGETEVLTSISGVVSAMVDEVIKDAAEEILGDLDYFKRLVFHSTTDMLIKASVTPLHKHGYDTVRYPPCRRCFPSHASPCFWLAVLGCGGRGVAAADASFNHRLCPARASDAGYRPAVQRHSSPPPLSALQIRAPVRPQLNRGTHCAIPHRLSHQLLVCHSALAEPLAPEASDQERYRREQEAERAQKQRDAGAESEDEDETLDLEFVDLAMSEVQVGCVATLRCATAARHALRGDTLSPHLPWPRGQMLVVDRNDKINAVKHDGVPDEAVQGERQYWRNIDVQPRHIELTRPCLPCFIAYHWGLFDVCARVWGLLHRLESTHYAGHVCGGLAVW
mgnify:CR=1 FL=1